MRRDYLVTWVTIVTVIFTCRYFKLSSNTSALSQSNCRNFSGSCINTTIAEKFLPFDWLRAEVFQLDLKCLQVSIKTTDNCNNRYFSDYFFPIVHLTLPSAILNKVHGKYLEQLKTFLFPVLQNAPAVTFVRCWRAQTGGWVASTFHNNCNGRGPTVTIIQVGGYVFGGYTSTSWSSEYHFITRAGFLPLDEKKWIYSCLQAELMYCKFRAPNLNWICTGG